jgi:deoxyribonuclease IV
MAMGSIRIGAHMSVAGGMRYAVERAHIHRCQALQVFTRNPNQWRSRPLDDEDVGAFRRRIVETGIGPVVSHASYLINLATTSPTLREQSIAAFVEELDRAETLGLLGVVLHPGTCTGGTERDALALVARGLEAALESRPQRKTMVLLEHTAGQGRTLGHRFEHLAAIIDEMDGSPRVGVCIDTCHLVAAGYDIVSPAGYRKTFKAFDRIVGMDRLKVFHANDSKKPCGSRVDRHEHIGEGCLGLEPFRRILHDERFAGLPMLIETAKTVRTGRADAVLPDPLDERNLETLRALRGDGVRS